MFNFKITYQKGLENVRADTFSRQAEYLGYKIEKKRAILKVKEDSYIYNYKLATISMLEDSTQEERLKEVYKIDKTTQAQFFQILENFTLNKQEILRFKGLVYIPTILQTKLVTEQYLLLAYSHQGITKTFEQITREYYFLGLKKEVEKVVLEYNIYNKTKLAHYALYRLLKLPLVATGAQKSIAIDFIVKLPLSREPITRVIYNTIQVTIERLTKYRKFILYKEGSTMEEFVYTFQKHIIADYRLPEKIISDRDKLQTSKFWKSLIA